jgi:hypothetical protein
MALDTNWKLKIMNKFLLKPKLYSCIGLMIIFAFLPLRALAYDVRFYSSNDILFYNPESCPAGFTAGGYTTSGNIVGNDNPEKIVRYFVGKGLSIEQASGIAGNFQQESGFNPYKIEGGSLADESYIPIENIGFGIAQWTTAKRQQALIDLASTSSRKITDFSLQLDYAWQELDGPFSGALANLKATNTPEEAAKVINSEYERSADTSNIRSINALSIYNKYKTTISDVGTLGTTSDLNCTEIGQPSEYIEGQPSEHIADFAIYNQYDPQWAKESYGTTTIGAAGCGPSAMAMIITALTGQTVTPFDTATYGAAHGTYAEGQGSYGTIARIVGEHWQLKASQIGPSVNQINEILRSGGLILASGAGSAPFTAGGHFIVIRAVTSSGMWLIGDSNGSKGIENSSKEWDPAELISRARIIWKLTK